MTGPEAAAVAALKGVIYTTLLNTPNPGDRRIGTSHPELARHHKFGPLHLYRRLVNSVSIQKISEASPAALELQTSAPRLFFFCLQALHSNIVAV